MGFLATGRMESKVPNTLFYPESQLRSPKNFSKPENAQLKADDKGKMGSPKTIRLSQVSRTQHHDSPSPLY